MTKLFKVNSCPGLTKDMDSGAVISEDSAAFEIYINNRNRMQQNHDDMISMQNNIDQLSSDMSELKTMMAILISR